MIRTRPIPNEPLLLVEGDLRVLVATDLHIGIEHQLWLGGASVPSQTNKMLEDLRHWVGEIKPDRLILLGDVKHNLPRTSFQEKSEVPSVLKSLSEVARVELVIGNHDIGISELAPKNTEIHPAPGFVLDGVGYFHGHTWPAPDLFEAEVLVASHLHPAVRLADRLGSGPPERAWVRAPLSIDGIREEWEARGEMKGIEKGIVEAIMEALEENTGHRPAGLKENLSAVRDGELLKKILRRAVKARTLEDFELALKELMPN